MRGRIMRSDCALCESVVRAPGIADSRRARVGRVASAVRPDHGRDARELYRLGAVHA